MSSFDASPRTYFGINPQTLKVACVSSSEACEVRTRFGLIDVVEISSDDNSTVRAAIDRLRMKANALRAETARAG